MRRERPHAVAARRDAERQFALRAQSKKLNAQSTKRNASRVGFTLVELLVSAGLVVLMLSLFATIFQLATGSMGTQRGIAQNDQKARTLTTVMRQDVMSRTFRNVVAHDPNEADYLAQLNPPQEIIELLNLNGRQGYFYISENDPDDDRDDVLCFTVVIESASTPFYGRAAKFFYNDLNQNGQAEPDEIYVNQPDMDDGQPGNESAISIAAEICYFLRRGNLYRRVMLIRPRSGSQAQPQRDDGVEFFDPNNDGQNGLPALYDGIFWRDFDYSAFYLPNGNKLQFHGVDSFDSTAVISLGLPRWRFGHNHATHLPREFINGIDPNTGNPAPNSRFIGRFTHEETSFSREDLNNNGRLDSGEDTNNNGRLDGFSYPFDTAGGNPMSLGTNLTDTDADGVVDQYEPQSAQQKPGPRRSEDIMMTHVHGFDVKVWDDRYGGWKNMGWREPQPQAGQEPRGDYSQYASRHRSPNPANAPHIAYGPHPHTAQNYVNRNRVFDSWHPALEYEPTTGALDAGQATTPAPAPAPYRPTRERIDSTGTAVLDPNTGLPIQDPIPMRAVQVTVRYYDVSSDQTRQLTLEFSLLD